VEGTLTRRRWFQRATVYALSMTLAGGATGAVFAAGGAGLRAVWDGAALPLGLALGAIAFVYASGEIGLISLPVPGRDWQVPATWVRSGFYRSAAIFGGTVGFGVFTRVPYASFPILLGWLFVSGNVVYGIAGGLVYGSARAISIYSSAPHKDTDELVQWNQRIMAMIPSVHKVTGLALAAFAAYLLVAPNI
jgi:hypothetical protein